METDEQVIQGVIERITFNNPGNGFYIFQLKVPNTKELLTIVGSGLDLQIGIHVVVRGMFRSHPKFGRQLAASTITQVLPTSPEGIERYLASGIIKGIGAGTAKKIVENFGSESLEVIFQDPKKLAHVSGIGHHKAKLIAEAFQAQGEVREVMQFLVANGVTLNLAQRIYDRYRSRSIEVVKNNPYILAREMKGIGFLTADGIGRSLGIAADSPERLRAGLQYALEKATDDGHCYLPQKVLFSKAQVLLGISLEIDLLPHLEVLLQDEDMVRPKVSGAEHAVFLRSLNYAEEVVANFIKDRSKPLSSPLISQRDVGTVLLKAEQSLKITFSDEQRKAVLEATHSRLLIITGGPGCGKTTIIKALSLLYRDAKKALLLAAPTGRAAQRMSQVCEFPASTIHRLLRFDPHSGRFVHGADDTLPVDAIIIDEASMIDVKLASALFQAIPKYATVILVGDKDQLPSVGPGRIFGDLIDCQVAPVIQLSQLFRRSDISSINGIAHMINAGQVPEIPEPDGVTKVDAYFIPRKDANEAAETIEKLVADQIPKKFDIPLEDILILTPSNRGPLGTIALNERLQQRLNPPIDSEQEIAMPESVLRLKDKVCQRVNNYQIDDAGVFNGDSGSIYSVDARNKSLVVDLWDGRLIKYSPFYQLSSLSSIHF